MCSVYDFIGVYHFVVRAMVVHVLWYNGACKHEPAHRGFNTEKYIGHEEYWPSPLTEATKEAGTSPHTKAIQPSFDLKDMTIQAGKSYDATLTCQHLTEGYVIQSISLIKDSTVSYVAHFGLQILRNRPIPINGLSFTVAPLQRVKSGHYLLTLTVGKYGKGSKATLQSTKCSITVYPSDAKVEEDSAFHHKTTAPLSMQHCATQTTISGDTMQSSLNNSMHENSQISVEQATVQTNESIGEPHFILHDITLQAGSSCLTTLKGLHLTNEYKIKSVAVLRHASSAKNTYCTDQFLTEKFKNQSIPVSGFIFPLTIKQNVKPGCYTLKLTIRKTNRAIEQQHVHCTITVVP